jgi:copper homeostasis protein
VLDKKGQVDEGKCKALLKAADPLPCTFHRAFDHVAQPLRSLETIIRLGFSRILTSGQQPSAQKGILYIKQLVIKAEGKISIVAGAGVNPDNIKDIVTRTGVREVHGSARVKVESKMTHDHLSSGGVSMGAPGSDDSAHFITDPDIVARIVLNGNSAVIQNKK